MAVAVSYPGVYIDEFAPGAPIQGVSTNVAAFVGPAPSGEINEPTKITSWDQFTQLYGRKPLNGYFLWYAVRGFFQNGGTVCYIVRASNGAKAKADIKNASGDKIAEAAALKAGLEGNSIVMTASLVDKVVPSGLKLFQTKKPYTEIKGRDVFMDGADARLFRAGDYIALTGADVAPRASRVLVTQVLTTGLKIDSSLGDTKTTGDVTLADLRETDSVIRVEPAEQSDTIPYWALVPGTTLKIGPDDKPLYAVIAAVQVEPLSPNVKTFGIILRETLGTVLLRTGNVAVTPVFFNLTVTQDTQSVTYANLASDPVHPRYYIDRVNAEPNLLRLKAADVPPTGGPDGALPKFDTPFSLAKGDKEDLQNLTDKQFIDAVDTLRKVSDVNLIAVPDGYARPNAITTATQDAVLEQCQNLGDRFAVFTTPPGCEPFKTKEDGTPSVEKVRAGLDSSRGYGALYYPWLKVRPADLGPPLLVPPVGHVCGVIARVDNTRGVFKAPANETIGDAIGLERTLSEVEHGQLNVQNINVLRVFREGGKPYVYGARTTATDRNWQYVNVRRLFLYIEKSLQQGIQWAVFEPNNKALWGKLKESISSFLLRVWRDGGLFGSTPGEAYYVRIDDVLNPFSEQALGRLNLEIGVRPTYPAEFIIVRIGIWKGSAEVTEA